MRFARFTVRVGYLLVPFLLVIFTVLCSRLFVPRPLVTTISAAEVSKSKEITLKADGLPHYLSIVISGKLDGRASIIDPWGNKLTIGPGEFRVPIQNEYYEGTATMHFIPENVNSGEVRVEYRFEI